MQNTDGPVTIDAGTSTAPGYINFLTGGFASTNERARITRGGEFGFGTTSPFALFSIHTIAGATGATTTLFAIASSTGVATSTLFKIDNVGNITASSSLSFGATAPIAGLSQIFNTNSNTGIRINGTTQVSMNVGGSSIVDFTATEIDTKAGISLLPLTANTGSIGVSASPYSTAYFTNSIALGTTSPWALLSVQTAPGATGATTTLFAVASSTGLATTTMLQFTNKGNLNIATSTASASTTISVGKIQWDGYSNTGGRVCVFIVGTTLTVAANACTP